MGEGGSQLSPMEPYTREWGLGSHPCWWDWSPAGGRGNSVLTHDGGVGAVGDAGDGVDTREDGADVVLVQLDGVGVREEVVAVRGCRRPVGVCAPDPDSLALACTAGKDPHTESPGSA